MECVGRYICALILFISFHSLVHVGVSGWTAAGTAREIAEVSEETPKCVLPRPDLRVVGGRSAKPGQFPYMVLIKAYTNEGTFLCGGTIIAPQFVLTAAHCVQDAPKDKLLLYTGGVDRQKTDYWVSAAVSELYIHEAYEPNRFYNDIALLKLEEELPIDGKNISTLDMRDNDIQPGTCCTISGWGSTRESGPSSSLLQFVHVPVVNRSLCTSLLKKEIREGEICAGFTTGGQDSCQGDSGGPLMCEGQLTGVVSWGDGCARKNKPGVYSNVSFYKDWVLQKMGTTRSGHVTSTLRPRNMKDHNDHPYIKPRDGNSAHGSAHRSIIVIFVSVFVVFMFNKILL